MSKIIVKPRNTKAHLLMRGGWLPLFSRSSSLERLISPSVLFKSTLQLFPGNLTASKSFFKDFKHIAELVETSPSPGKHRCWCRGSCCAYGPVHYLFRQFETDVSCMWSHASRDDRVFVATRFERCTSLFIDSLLGQHEGNCSNLEMS